MANLLRWDLPTFNPAYGTMKEHVLIRVGTTCGFDNLVVFTFGNSVEVPSFQRLCCHATVLSHYLSSSQGSEVHFSTVIYAGSNHLTLLPLTIRRVWRARRTEQVGLLLRL